MMCVRRAVRSTLVVSWRKKALIGRRDDIHAYASMRLSQWCESLCRMEKHPGTQDCQCKRLYAFRHCIERRDFWTTCTFGFWILDDMTPKNKLKKRQREKKGNV